MIHALRVWEAVWESPGRASLPPSCSACRSAHAPLEPRVVVAAAERTQRQTACSPSCASLTRLLLLEQADPKPLRRFRSKPPREYATRALPDPDTKPTRIVRLSPRFRRRS